MRKINVFMMIATSVLAIASCNKEMNEPAAKQSAKSIRFVANSVETKTTFGTPTGTTYPVYWNEGDSVKFKIASNPYAAYNVPVVPSADRTTATFEIDLTKIKEGSTLNTPYIFRFISPASATIGFNTPVQKKWGIVVPDEQTPTASSVDPAAQILAASTGYNKDEYTSVDMLPESINLDFDHLTAYGKFSITNCTPSSAVSFVKLTFETPVSGQFVYSDGIEPSTGVKTSEPSMLPSGATKSISINTTSLQNIWFACAPASVAGTQMKVEVVVGDQEYVKTVTLGSKNFEAGKIAKFSVDFSGITPTAYTPAGDIVYSLVTSVDELSSGDEVIIANTANSKAVSSTQGSTNRSGVAVTIADNKITNPDGTIQVFILGKNGSTFCFKNDAGNYFGASKDAAGKYYFRQIASADDAYHNVTIASNGDATVEKDTITLLYNAGTNAFNVFTTDKASGKLPVQFYKKVE